MEKITLEQAFKDLDKWTDLHEHGSPRERSVGQIAREMYELVSSGLSNADMYKVLETVGLSGAEILMVYAYVCVKGVKDNVDEK